ncbi:phenylpropionate dioxygenase-like ring-hydroxylating dioxygenase large terminal subunit [Paenibacillus forsythiae]|uniref:Phenylpropionate dioxygenase-like ring-hydroxylating dioxygenase large terminal subunit n=1 Tax=Paenibacillus forsythiae TaxID=365616 RepID=A0ABU3H4S4_9BACL|nr:Rieske 2Fe-2S domain-containing protein [Paenibacillus forsythiae]MDT3425829.1 phenylpropionate dioxygenase-like ring-hydroxylating dioxygenase large terminal subunit [Paenibacillus forsythiae]
MLKTEDNKLLTQTDAGTPMGELFRKYWIPVVNSNEIAEPNGKPLKIKILGEDLLIFRDSEGKVGLVDEKCPHRRTSLSLGINADCGLTCIYHGWKFDVEGNCLDIPSEPAESKMKKAIHLKSYSVQEKNGIIWGYLGPKESEPPFPEFYWMGLPDDQLISERVWQECNYLQVMENDVDYVHAAFLHKALNEQNISSELLSSDLGINPSHPLVKNPPVKQAVENTNYGKRCIGVGVEDEDNFAFMEIHYIFPFYTFPPRMEGEDGMWHAFIPRDDHSTWSWDVQFSHNKPIDGAGQSQRRGLILDENFRKLRNLGNDYEQDRDLMIDGNYSGIRGIANQDHAVTETMGPIVDRSKEHLGTSDLPLIHIRKMLLEQVKGLKKKEKELHEIPLKKLFSCGTVDSKTKTWREAIPLQESFQLSTDKHFEET